MLTLVFGPNNQPSKSVLLRRLSSFIPIVLLLSLFSGFIQLPKAHAAEPGDFFVFPAQSPVAPDGNSQYSPALSGNIVLWSDNDTGLGVSRIFFKDLSKGAEELGHPLISGQRDGGNPAISRSGNRVVWTEGISGGTSLHVYYRNVDFSGASGDMECLGALADCQAWAVSPTYFWQENPSISSDGTKVAWQHGRTGDIQIHMYDFNTGIEQEVYGMPDGDQMFPSVDDEWIVWQDYRNYNDLGHANDQAIYAKRIGSFGPPIVVASFQNDANSGFYERARVGRNPANEPVVVYTQHNDAPPYNMNNLETIYLYNLVTGTNQMVKQKLGYTASLSSPSVDGDKLVWIDRTTNSHGDLVFYNMTTGQETVVTQDPDLGALSPSVSNGTGNIVWATNNGIPYTIYSNRIGTTAQMLADKYKPELRMTSEENPFEPIPIEQFLTEQNHWGFTQLERRTDPEFLFLNPTAAVLAEFAATADLYINLPGNSFTAGGGNPSCTIDDRKVYDFYFDSYKQHKNNFTPTIYTRVVSRPPGNENSFIQYWIFYEVNNHPDLFHEGDWELVQVDLDANLKPYRADYSQHGNGTYRNWDGSGSVEKSDRSADTPVVYVAQGSHANYFESGDEYNIVPKISWDVAIDSGNSLYNLYYPVTVIPEVEQSAETPYEWLQFQGQWGEYTGAAICNGETDHRDGPSNPPTQASWINAFGWSDNEDDCDSCSDGQAQGTNTQATALSPVDIHFYDAQGRHTGKNADGSIDQQIPNSEYFEYPDLHRKSIIIRGGDIHAGYRFEAVGNGTGPADFIVTAPDHPGGSVDTLNYNLVEVNPSTKITMTLDADYTMAIDTNGDGSDVIQKDPDVITTNQVDFTAPAPVVDLSATSAEYGRATLSFTAPGDDGDQGTAKAYIVRYSTSAIAEQYLQDTIPVNDELPAPMTGGSAQSINVSGLVPGNTYYFALKAVDDVSLASPLSNVTSVYIPTDSQPPDITNLSGGWLVTGSPAISATYSDIDPSSGVNTASATISLNGGAPLACSATGGSISCALSGLADGHYDYTLSIADNAGNLGTATGNFDVDAVAPVLSGPSPTSFINTGSTTIGTSYADTGSGINSASIQVSLDGSAVQGCTATAASVSCPVEGLGEGAHTFLVTVGDVAGNTGTGSGSFSVDTAAPFISNILPIGNGNSSSPTSSASYSDALSGINTGSATAALDGTALSGCTRTASGISCPSAGLASGAHSITITVSDNADNLATVAGTFNVARNYYWSWYDYSTAGFKNWVMIANGAPTGSPDLWFNLSIAGTNKPLPALPGYSPGQIPPGGVLAANYPGVMGGPVRGVSLTGGKAVITQRTLLNSGSLEEIYAMDEGRLSDHYYWPWYDATNGVNDWVLVAPHSNAVYYEIKVGGINRSSGNIPPGSSVAPKFPGVMGGPVEVQAWTDSSKQAPSKVITAQRVLNSSLTAFNEVQGTPAGELASTYLWPWYDQQSQGMTDWVLVVNHNQSAVYYEIRIAGMLRSSGTIPPGGTAAPTFPGVWGGPVRVEAWTNSTKVSHASVVSSQRVTYGPSFEEVPGTPADSLVSNYLWPWYDNQSAGAGNWILVMNTNASSIYYEIKVAGQLRSSGNIAAGGYVVPNYPGLAGGPVEVKAWTSSTKQTPANVIASQRVLWNGYFNELVGSK